eukprot:TRINITY_DN13438_c1_g3_i1.p1 TRINITY_DN13438_c1_g3~~TRINITY_DN13438_c1_g3_i1.p1  ORF type:complete len:1059 (+),score=401.30 TRINITY_DN13438_c1_g3_i1:79-3177(+)
MPVPPSPGLSAQYTPHRVPPQPLPAAAGRASPRTPESGPCPAALQQLQQHPVSPTRPPSALRPQPEYGAWGPPSPRAPPGAADPGEAFPAVRSCGSVQLSTATAAPGGADAALRMAAERQLLQLGDPATPAPRPPSPPHPRGRAPAAQREPPSPRHAAGAAQWQGCSSAAASPGSWYAPGSYPYPQPSAYPPPPQQPPPPVAVSAASQLPCGGAAAAHPRGAGHACSGLPPPAPQRSPYAAARTRRHHYDGEQGEDDGSHSEDGNVTAPPRSSPRRSAPSRDTTLRRLRAERRELIAARDELEIENTELVRQRGLLEQERREVERRLQGDLDAERDQNQQSANVITAQMALIDSLKGKMDTLARQARGAASLEEARQAHEMEVEGLRRSCELLSQQLDAERQRCRRLEHEQGAWRAERVELARERDSAQAEAARSAALREQGAAEERRRAEARERQLVQEHERELAQREADQLAMVEEMLQQREAQHRDELRAAVQAEGQRASAELSADLAALRADRDALARRVQEIQGQREEEALRLQRQIDTHLGEVEQLKAELVAKRLELWQEWQMWYEERKKMSTLLEGEKQRLASTVQEERRELQVKMEQQQQKMAAELRRVQGERANVVREADQLSQRQESTVRARAEWESERDRWQQQLREQQTALEGRERHLQQSLREVEALRQDAEAAPRLRQEAAALQQAFQREREQREAATRQLADAQHEYSRQVHETTERYHRKLEEQCLKHTHAIELLRGQLAAAASRTSPPRRHQPRGGSGSGGAGTDPVPASSPAIAERRLGDMERRLLESEHALGQAEARCSNLQSEAAASEERCRRHMEHAEELARQIDQYRQELTAVRGEREGLRRELARGSPAAERARGLEAELERVSGANAALSRQLELATMANQAGKLVFLCEAHRADGFEGLVRHDLEGEEDDAAPDREQGKECYTKIIANLERARQQPFVCAGCVTEQHHAFDKLHRMVLAADERAADSGAVDEVMALLMALTSRLPESGERRVRHTADSLLQALLRLT